MQGGTRIVHRARLFPVTGSGRFLLLIVVRNPRPRIRDESIMTERTRAR